MRGPIRSVPQFLLVAGLLTGVILAAGAAIHKEVLLSDSVATAGCAQTCGAIYLI
jgi:hypothetical protein